MEYSIKPEEHELREARQEIEKAVEKVKHSLPKDKDVEFRLAWEGRQEVVEEMEGVDARTFSSTVVTLSFNSNHDKWKDSIRRNTVHEFGHTYFYEKNDDLSDFIWQWILEEALTQKLAEKIYPDSEAPYWNSVGQEELEDKWPEVKQIISDEMDYDHELFFGGENFERWTGYSLAFKIGEKLLEKHELEEFPELKRSDVIEAGDELFD